MSVVRPGSGPPGWPVSRHRPPFFKASRWRPDSRGRETLPPERLRMSANTITVSTSPIVLVGCVQFQHNRLPGRRSLNPGTTRSKLRATGVDALGPHRQRQSPLHRSAGHGFGFTQRGGSRVGNSPPPGAATDLEHPAERSTRARIACAPRSSAGPTTTSCFTTDASDLDSNELKVRIRVAERVLALTSRVQKQSAELRYHVTHDGLTGLWNREALLSLIFQETDRVQRMKTLAQPHAARPGQFLADQSQLRIRNRRPHPDRTGESLSPPDCAATTSSAVAGRTSSCWRCRAATSKTRSC